MKPVPALDQYVEMSCVRGRECHTGKHMGALSQIKVPRYTADRVDIIP